MFGSTSFFLSWIAVITLSGAVLYVIDRNIGVRIYRWIYDMTHEHPLAEDQIRGFLYQRKTHTRFAVAVFITFIQAGVAIVHGVSSISMELLSTLIDVPCLMLGFSCGPMLYRFWSKREQVFETVDQIENGEISITNEVREMSEKAVSKIKETMTTTSAQEIPSTQGAEAAESKHEETEPDPKILMDKYLNPR